jgi:hypothetical protein
VRSILGLALLLACAGSYAQQYNRFDIPREVRCSAFPGPGQAGCACKGVEETYRGAEAGSAKNSIVQACVKANRPDRCNCIQQCRQVARCSKI